MVYRKTRNSSSWSPPSQEEGSQFAPRPFTVQAQQESSGVPSHRELHNEAFHQNRFEAFTLQRKEKSGTITPVEQERLGVLQAKMSDFWTMRRAAVQPNLLGMLNRNANKPQAPVQSNTIQAKADTTGESADAPIEQSPNTTGLPDALKAGVENLSGYSLDDVRVHYNSPKPAQLHALAYTQGTDIHVAPGQEQHLPHEAWHVVQQMQGRVKPTVQLKGGFPANDDQGLEHEADVRGSSAARGEGSPINRSQDHGAAMPSNHSATVQRKVGRGDGVADMNADQIQQWLTKQGLWEGITNPVLTVIERMMQSEHQWMYGGFFSYLLVRDAKALVNVRYHQGLIHGDLIGVKNEADFHVDPGDGRGLSADMLIVAEDASERMIAANTVHGAPKGRVYLRPQGAAIIKIISQVLGEALGDPQMVEQAHKSIKWRKLKEAALDKVPFYKRPKLSKEVLDQSVVPEHSAYMKSLVGVSGVDIKPLLSGAKSMEEFTQNMLEESEMGRARLKKYLETVEQATVPVSMDIYIGQDQLPTVVRLLKGQR